MKFSLFFAIKVSSVIITVTLYIVYTLYTNQSLNKKKKFPPYTSKCPDYWDIVDEYKCKNTKKIGKCLLGDNNIMDFNETIFKGKDSDYYKCRWAVKCEVPWEGIDILCS